ncbi:MAG: polyprenyl synthetase family protein [Promethearchaeota archaeon]
MVNNTSLLHNLKQNATDVDEFLLDFLHTPPNESITLWDASRHYIQAGGKRLRPFLVNICYGMFSENREETQFKREVLPIAAAIELLHTFTLIHDDIMDHDPKRRGVQSVHTKWGEDVAILAGDLLFASVFTCVNTSTLLAPIVNRLMQELGQAGVDVCRGQAYDIQFETVSISTITISDYLHMIRLKTGALLSTSAVLGGICASCSVNELDLLRVFGHKFGLAFQLIDDILGMTADEATLGKPVGSDLREGKMTYIVLQTYEFFKTTAPESAQEFAHLMEKKIKGPAEIEQLKKYILQSGSIDDARDLSQKYLHEAKSAILQLSELPDSTHRQNLLDLIDYSLTRTS